jgi:hypothetical protein
VRVRRQRRVSKEERRESPETDSRDHRIGVAESIPGLDFDLFVGAFEAFHVRAG